MTTGMKRERLVEYLNQAADRKIKAIYALLEHDIDNREPTPAFTRTQLENLEKRRSVTGAPPSGIDWHSMHDNTRIKRRNY
jgi:hypothetical protein